ncbi:MAG: AAA family ATPase, partial [Syntrophomonadaceae bacterium]
MLQEIYIHNFILIDELRLEFAPGINVLSGETGAGKSIIVDALGLALGDRINNSFIRDTSRKALVEAVFDVGRNEEARIFLAQQGLAEADDGDIIILSREIYPNGRTAARINGRNVTAALLKNLSAYLVDIHLQSDRQNILQPARFLEYVDRYANDLADLPKEVAYLYRLLADKQRQLEELVINRQNRMQRLDFLGYQIKEIEDSKLQEGEEERLKAIRDRIKDAGKLLAASSRILELIYVAETGSSAYDQVAAAIDIVAANRRDS